MLRLNLFLRLVSIAILGSVALPLAATAPPNLPAAHTLKTLDPVLFPVPQELKPNLSFWLDIFGRYTSHQVVFHDEDHVHIVYAVLDFTDLDAKALSEVQRRKTRRDRVRKMQRRYRDYLETLAKGGNLRDADEQRRLELLFASVPGKASKYRQAIQRFRTQTGLRDEFEAAIPRAGAHLPAMERLFRQRDLPVDLTRMAFVESMFRKTARSSVGAGGVWQIMPATGRRFLEIGTAVDERYDPVLAAGAAASLLEEKHALLGNWPLAVTAYNHGRYGMKRAVKQVGTSDPGKVLTRYRSRSYGFASKNFYAEFLAAALIYNNRDRYFPGVQPGAPVTFDELELPLYVAAQALAQEAGTDYDELKKLNPGVGREVWNGSLYLPKSYKLRVPNGDREAFRVALTALPDNRKSTRQVGLRYRVRHGDTLSTIARKYGTSVRSLQRANRLASAHRIRAGQVLLIPPAAGGRRTSAAAAPQVATQSGGRHTVRRGEALSTIATAYGTSVQALVAMNGLRNSHHIQVGQQLQIPAGTGKAGRHVVKPGETLAHIAGLYGTTVKTLQQVNRIRNHLIYPRQVLIIP